MPPGDDFSANRDLDLIGYHLGLLPEHESERVENALASDPELAVELARIVLTFDRLDGADDRSELPPPNLLSSTMAKLDQVAELNPSDDTAATSGTRSAGDDSLASGDANLGDVRLGPAMGAATGDGREVSRWSLVNVAAVAAAAILLMSLALPTIGNWRESARRQFCRDHMRTIGGALTTFVDRDPRHRLPAVARRGAEAFSGMYAIRLFDQGLMPDPSVRWCVSRSGGSMPHPPDDPALRLVSVREVSDADVQQLQMIQRYAGGDYAYNLGVMDGPNYQSPRHESRATFAILSDASHRTSAGRWQSDHVDGVNVLYEDGSVNYVGFDTMNALPDHPMLNHRRQTEAGVTIDDASLAPSWRAPFVDSPQR